MLIHTLSISLFIITLYLIRISQMLRELLFVCKIGLSLLSSFRLEVELVCARQ